MLLLVFLSARYIPVIFCSACFFFFGGVCDISQLVAKVANFRRQAMKDSDLFTGCKIRSFFVSAKDRIADV